MNIGNSYHSMFYANNYSQNTTNTQSSSTTNNVSQNSFLAQLEKSQETSQVEQSQKKDYSSMSLDELNNLSYEEYKTYGDEIWERAIELRDTAEAKGVYTEEIFELKESVVAKTQLANYTYDDDTNKALIKSLEEYNGDVSYFMLDLDIGARRNVYINEGGGTQEFLNLTKEQRTAALSIDGASQVTGYYNDILETGQREDGSDLSIGTKQIHDLWSSILENLIKQIDVEVYA